MEYPELAQKANTIRRLILEIVNSAASGHLGGSLSAVEILTCLYGKVMRYNPADPTWAGRDRFVLSKGHATPVYYSTLAEFGFFPISTLQSFRAFGSCLQGHPDRRKTPGVDMNTGSLGQGVSAAAGMALGAKLSGSAVRVYTLLGDGELQEGQVWEALMFAAQKKLDNLTLIIDNNDLQCDGHLEEVVSPYPLREKLEAFRFHVQCVDGHNIPALLSAFSHANACNNAPSVIIAKTTKGKGVSFMENCAEWHGKVPNAQQFEQAMNEIEKAGAMLCQM